MQEPDTTSRAPQLLALTSLRGLAALWVMAHNDGPFREATGFDDWTQILAKGYLAVDFFLLLSGFILTYVHGEQFLSKATKSFRQDWCRFIILRLARIYPLYLFLLFVRVLIELAKWQLGAGASFAGPAPFEDGNSPWALICNLLMIQAWGLFDDLTWVPTFWTVSAEWFAYLLFPLLLFFCGPMWKRRGGAILTGLLLLILLGVLIGWHGDLELPMQVSLLRCVPEFVLGMLFGLHWSTLRCQRWLANFGLQAVLWTTLLIQVHFGFEDWIALLVLPLLLISAAVRDANSEPRAFRWMTVTPLVFLGEISYAIYLSHMIVQSGFRVAANKVFAEPSTSVVWGLFFVKLGITLVGSVLLYRLVEVPAREWIRGRLRAGDAGVTRSELA